MDGEHGVAFPTVTIFFGRRVGKVFATEAASKLCLVEVGGAVIFQRPLRNAGVDLGKCGEC
jgi:hypothetical protein